MTDSNGLPSNHLLWFLVFFWRWVQNICSSTSICSNELFGCDAVQGGISISLARIHIRTKPNFEMQMCQIGTFGRSHRADLVAALHQLADFCSDRLQMRIHGLDHMTEFVSFRQAVGNQDHFAPSWPRATGIHHAPGSCRVNCIAEIGVSAADAIQIVAQVPRDAERPRVVGECAMLRPHRHVKPGSERQGGDFKRSQPHESRIERRESEGVRGPKAKPDHADDYRQEGEGQKHAHDPHQCLHEGDSMAAGALQRERAALK